MKKYVIQINIKHAKPEIKREVEVDSELTFLDLHFIIQAAFGLSALHHAKFKIGKTFIVNDEELQLFDVVELDKEDLKSVSHFQNTRDAMVALDDIRMKKADESTLLQAVDIKLSQMLEENMVFKYCYDFGDEWCFQVKIVAEIAAKNTHALLTKWENFSILEDIGGMDEFNKFAALYRQGTADPEDYAEYLWAINKAYPYMNEEWNTIAVEHYEDYYGFVDKDAYEINKSLSFYKKVLASYFGDEIKASANFTNDYLEKDLPIEIKFAFYNIEVMEFNLDELLVNEI